MIASISEKKNSMHPLSMKRKFSFCVKGTCREAGDLGSVSNWATDSCDPEQVIVTLILQLPFEFTKDFCDSPFRFWSWPIG